MKAMCLAPAASNARLVTAPRWARVLPCLAGPAPAPTRLTSTTTPAAAGAGSPNPSSFLHETASKGPQPETLFRPDAASLAAAFSPASASSGGDKQEGVKEGDLPGFTSIPTPDYEVERPQEQTPAEPDNPLPQELPANHPGGEEAPLPESPQPLEVPLPRRDEQDMPSRPPPDIVPSPGWEEAPRPSPPMEVPGTVAPPEFSPGTPSEMPQRGGSEINFPM